MNTITATQKIDYFIEQVNKLNDNISYWKSHQEYSLKMDSRYALFFAKKRENKDFETCFSVFSDIPKPQNESEQNAYFEKKASLFNHFLISK